jgi:hypothetical protein
VDYGHLICGALEREQDTCRSTGLHERVKLPIALQERAIGG